MKKLIIAVVQNEDADAVVDALLEEEFRATRLASTGGFLRRGNTTLMIGADEDQVDRVLDLIRQHARSGHAPADDRRHPQPPPRPSSSSTSKSINASDRRGALTPPSGDYRRLALLRSARGSRQYRLPVPSEHSAGGPTRRSARSAGLQPHGPTVTDPLRQDSHGRLHLGRIAIAARRNATCRRAALLRE